ncbi:DUF2306 domain-containing protein [Mucilaginibacter phyllosphaerae]|uniref:DUF2306 domain-containing protein n=1 Tax=Mucilaginibacter phyllosphaerae TaxID=1812349 RepID=A0A4Y8A886_9SPHI|nr:DUF2306 domain-containing protein [Mucilaginibacter phyllosphaerae]MBB3970984.1 putative membrane protein [Mucilaginibacter phyllosphaerae]TEW64084.1 DUF2306 domain-containing protein [Mucilaginibacter phyllosphaerae]GGH05874.1 hypothetical protein GCM10007352_09840 [Mucilaginibacter phyllosphaerae]
MKFKNLPWIPFAFFAIAVGLYPLLYLLIDMQSNGLLHSKPKAVLNNSIWSTAFYIHIAFGGLALLIGWTQFSARLRQRYLNSHRLVGKIYVIAVALSSIAGLYIAFFATGGIVCVLGFGLLAIIWLISNIMGYLTIRRGHVPLHQKWMIFNYALTFAAVTLRVWLSLLIIFVFHDFVPAYRVVSWLCWVPNLIIALIIITKRNNAASPLTL